MSEENTDEEAQNRNSEEKEEEKPKTKFTFVCTRCDECCLERGPIPITFWDLEMWAKNGVLANFMPYLEVYNKPDEGMDLIIKPLTSSKESKEQKPEDAFKETPVEDLLDEKCPLYNKEQNKCLVYNNRPLSCRTYPLEYDGTHYSIIDVDCPGIGEEGMTKEDLKEMRDRAQKMNYELTRIRIALPVLNQILTRKVMMDLMKQNMELFRNS
jgi:Fe-S-cluster containining protein